MFAGVSIKDRYAAALDMTEFADRNGFLTVILSEHHGSPDGYLPSALPFAAVVAAAVAARTEQVRIMVAAPVSSFHDPLKVAEDVAVVDAISGGRPATATPSAVLHPMMGGIPPALAWESLRLIETEVIPELT